MLHQSATGRKKPFVGWAGPVGPAAAAVAKSLSDTESMGNGSRSTPSFPRSRYPYLVPRIRMCALAQTISSRSSVTASTAFLWTFRPHERRTSTLKYLFVFSSASICLFDSVLFYLLLALHYISSVFPNPVNHQLRYPTNLSSPPSNTKLTMAGSAPAAAKDIKSVLENKPLKFKFKTGGASYIAQVHTDRSSYERVKSTRTSSADSISSASTTGSK
ncbi:hypothetical protein FJTKL_03068 [Diaporthe vaccinii]|uniref:Uncharacterized protein n=1 Tax=Diaporthe vaccinii TaxID=105482 RepID=A0ABR4DWG0_9PEZI